MPMKKNVAMIEAAVRGRRASTRELSGGCGGEIAQWPPV
jgi:hypothetical protein